MGRSLPPLRALEAFEAVARHNSVTRAAEELALTPSAISHRLRNLEIHLGIRLFDRGGRAMSLTGAGREYLESVSSAFERIRRSSDRLAGGMVSDVLTVHCPPSFAPAWLVPRIGKFKKAHPDIDLRIHASPEPVDFFRSDTDVEIRYGNSDWAGLVVTQLLKDAHTPLCSPTLFEQIKDRPRNERLAGMPLIVSERAPMDWSSWFTTKGVTPQYLRGPRFDRGYLALQAAALGFGVALESTIFAASYLTERRLVPVFDNGGIVIGAHTLVYPPAYATVRKVCMFRDWAIEEFIDLSLG